MLFVRVEMCHLDVVMVTIPFAHCPRIHHTILQLKQHMAMDRLELFIYLDRKFIIVSQSCWMLRRVRSTCCYFGFMADMASIVCEHHLFLFFFLKELTLHSIRSAMERLWKLEIAALVDAEHQLLLTLSISQQLDINTTTSMQNFINGAFNVRLKLIVVLLRGIWSMRVIGA